MPCSVKRPRRVFLITLTAIGLLVAGALVAWSLPRFLPKPTAAASDAYSRGDWEQTALLAHERLKRAPDDPEALRLAARAAAHQGRDQSAIAIYSRLDVGFMQPNDFFLMGQALSRTGQLDPAYKAFETARAGNPDDPDTLDVLCRLYYQKDLYYAAEEAAQRLVRQPGWEARAQLMLGIARAELDDPAGVATALRQWLQLDPEGHAAAPDPVRPLQVLLARSLLKSSQPAEARQILQKLLQAGADPELTWLLSRTYLQEGNWSQALAAWKQDPSFRSQNAAEPEPAPYVGEARCAECHQPEFDAVLASRHAATFFRARDLKNLTLPKEPLPDPGNPEVTHVFEREGDRLRLATHTSDRVFQAVIDYGFGSRNHFTTFVGRDDRNRSFMLRMSSYESPQGTAWDIATALPPRPADEEEYLGKIIPNGDGARRCLFCHTTSFRAVKDEIGPEAADHSIGCEKCHGPGGHHVAAVKSGFADMAIACPDQTPPAQVNAICGRCHGFSRAEKLWTNRTDPALYRFQSVTMTWSRCFSESGGKLSCTTCHDPHRDAERSTARNEARCLFCHAGDSGSPPASALSAAATRHPAPSSGEQASRGAKSTCPVNPTKGCLECHMPRAWQQDTHTFKTDHFIRVREKPAAGK